METLKDTEAVGERARGLTPDEITHYLEKGFVGPFTMHPPEAMVPIKEHVLNEVLQGESPHPIERFQCRHLDSRVIYDLLAHPAITERIASIFGPNLMLWRSQIFAKDIGEGELGWHQDVAYFHMLEPPITISAWVAISDATPENGCVEFVPGSHRRNLTHEPTHRSFTSRMKKRVGGAAPYKLRPKLSKKDTESAVKMPVEAGQFFLFNERVLHTSGPNRTNEPRVGVAARITTDMVRLQHDKVFQGHSNVVIHGRDSFGHSRTVPPPK